jgi:hypothetical protein
MITGKKMPQVLRLGANPPFQRVEETTGACKKARLFAIVGANCCNAAELLFRHEKMLLSLTAVCARSHSTLGFELLGYHRRKPLAIQAATL